MTYKTMLLHLVDKGSGEPMTLLLEYLAASNTVALTAIAAKYETVKEFDRALEELDPRDYSFIWVDLKDAGKIHEALGELLRREK